MKVKLRKVKYKHRFSNIPESYKEMEIDCQGTGSKEDPLIIDYIKDKSLNLDILESDKYIIIRNCTLSFLCFYYSKNISVVDSKFRNLHLGHCENIHIERVVSSWIEIFECNECSLIESRSEEAFGLYKSHNNVFKNCEFWNYFSDFHFLSRNNEFVDNQVFDPEEFVFKSIQDTDFEEKTSYLINCISTSQGYESCDVDCKGTGRKEDPYIIDTLDSIDYKIKTIELFNRRDHLIFKNLNIKNMRLYDVKFVQFDNCNFSGALILKFCSDIKMNLSYSKDLKLGSCYNIDISNSEFNKIEVFKGLESKIELNNCTYKKINKALL